jgi:glutamate-ammonia-ligase adenylyltransferase
MQIRRYLEDPQTASDWLAAMGLHDVERAHADLSRLSAAGVPPDLLETICEQLARELPQVSDPDMALSNLERFIAAARHPLGLAALFERDPDALPPLLHIFSTSQYLSDQLVRDPESFDLLRITEGAPVRRDELVAEICAEVDTQADDEAVMATVRRYKHRETLRIAYGDIVRGQRLETVTSQISYLADALVEAVLRYARRKLEAKRGVPRNARGEPARFVVLALGKLGGVELNYSSDIDLVLLYDDEGRTDGPRSQTNQEFFERLAREMVRLLAETTELGAAYRVDLRLRPEGSQGPIAGTLPAYVQYYDNKGRTWERQAYVKARPIAGDLALGAKFLKKIQPWIYRRFLSRADITGIKSLKRRIERQAHAVGDDAQNVKTGHGGIRDIEFSIQFLQLLNGSSAPSVRTGNTLEAITRLEEEGSLSHQESDILGANYRMLRKLEHRLQIMFDLQTHLLPTDEEEMRKLALRLGYQPSGKTTALAAFRSDLEQRTAENRKILDHLLHDAFGPETDIEAEVDLVNDPDPGEQQIQAVLAQYPFQDVDAAYRNLMALATEKIRFLSTRRCRHFLAAISPQLLKAIATTPDPDATLVDLSQVSDSLGGKGVLWELFSFNPASLTLYVRLCAACSYLTSILTSNPGMIDELMDSLLLDRLPDFESLEAGLADLCRGAEDLEPILHSFKDSQHLRVGVRDIVGRDDVQATHAALSDIAEVCLGQIVESEFATLARKFGQPMIVGDEGPSAPSELVILALGKLGGREPNYHSDLDVVFLYTGEGATVQPPRSNRQNTTTNQHFFSELGQRIIKVANRLGPYGRLYEVDPRLRPTGRSGALAVPVEEFARYFREGDGQLWERQSLCKARAVYGSLKARKQVMAAAREAAFGPPWLAEQAHEIHQMRTRLEETASRRNIKRGPGGTVDIEFVVQMLQLKHGGSRPEVQAPGTLDALDALHAANCLSDDDYEHFSRAYRHLRSIEAHIRLMNAKGRHEMPTEELELSKLAFLLNYSTIDELVEATAQITIENRRRFERIFAAAG